MDTPTDDPDRNIKNLFFCGSMALLCALVNTVGIAMMIGSTDIVSLMTVSLVFIAPLIEEYMKRIAVVRGMPWMFLLVFCGVETMFLAEGTGIPGLVMRIIPCMMHAVTMAIQWQAYRYSMETKSPMASVLGFLGAFLIHAIYNATVVLAMVQMLG